MRNQRNRGIPSLMELRPPLPDEIDALSELCLRSKAVWGYDAAFLEACREELSLTPEAIGSGMVAVAVNGTDLIGVAEISVEGDAAVLEKAFVDPDHMGRGVGRRLFDWAVGSASGRGARVMTIDSDPGAADFYQRMGATRDGQSPSGSIPGRFLPRFVLRLDA